MIKQIYNLNFNNKQYKKLEQCQDCKDFALCFEDLCPNCKNFTYQCKQKSNHFMRQFTQRYFVIYSNN